MFSGRDCLCLYGVSFGTLVVTSQPYKPYHHNYKANGGLRDPKSKILITQTKREVNIQEYSGLSSISKCCSQIPLFFSLLKFPCTGKVIVPLKWAPSQDVKDLITDYLLVEVNAYDMRALSICLSFSQVILL